MQWDDLPTPSVLTDDLAKIVHELERYKGLPLLALRALPSVQLWHPSRVSQLETGDGADPSDALEQRERSNNAIRIRICQAIGRMEPEEERDALSELFCFEEVKRSLADRYEAAARCLDCSAETVRKVRESKLLVTLADEMFRGELVWAISQLEPIGVPPGHLSVNAWGHLVDFERSVIVNEDDPSKQLWSTRLVVRCVKPDQPFWITSMHWTGSKGVEEKPNITILSGPQDKDTIFPHRLLSVRPESDSSDAYMLYLWDLGAPVFAGEDVELHWQQKLVDEKGTFKPFIGFGTETHPELKRLRFRVKVSSHLALHARGKQLAVQDGILAGSYPSQVARIIIEEPITARDSESYFTYEPAEITPGARYELWWD